MEREKECNDLPEEMKELVLKKLDYETKTVARLVCKQWKSTVESDLRFEISLTDDTYTTFRNFDAETRIEKLVVQDFQKAIPSLSSTRSGLNKNIRFLRIGLNKDFPGDSPDNPYCLSRMSEYDKKFPETKGISPANLKTLLKVNTGIEALSVCGTAFKGFTQTAMLKRIQWHNLTILDINFGKYHLYGSFENQPVEPFVLLLKKVHPSLHTLLYSSTSWRAEFRLFVAVLECVAAHKETIRKVKILHSTHYSLTDAVELGYPQEKYNILAKNLCEARLDYLMLDLMKCGPYNGDRWKLLQKSFVESQKKLEDLRLISIAPEAIDVNYELIFNSINSTVIDLTLWMNREEPFDCGLLKKCTKLRDLTLRLTPIEFIDIDQPPVMLIRNLTSLPKSLAYLLCGQMLTDADCVWLTKNMLDLEIVIYDGVQHVSEIRRTLEHFLLYLNLPKFRQFRINNFKCGRIIQFAQLIPGITVNQNVTGTDININRTNFTNGGYYVLGM